MVSYSIFEVKEKRTQLFLCLNAYILTPVHIGHVSTDCYRWQWFCKEPIR